MPETVPPQIRLLSSRHGGKSNEDYEARREERAASCAPDFV